jgi:phosphatidylserine/phosphatidylglycerophosphate/cardiolipin synthase-like enzyme
VDYSSIDNTAVPSGERQLPDLPAEIYGGQWQIWHDQHLRLTGPIVRTIEEQFRERWRDTAKVYDQNSWFGRQNYFTGQVIFSSPLAFDTNSQIIPLDLAAPAAPDGTSDVQMWRTIPVRESRQAGPFVRAEFTVMAGLVKAIKASRQLIWMFDQYFWSRPLARLLNAQIKQHASLCVLIVLPPHADTQPAMAHRARQLAFTDLMDGLTLAQRGRVGLFNLWHPVRKQGIYCHAKTHTYDGSLLVCGSANLNRRSFTCDTELAMAVLDPAVIADHQRRLWGLLFPSAPWPGIDLETNGQAFMTQFFAASRMSDAFVIPDPWQNSAPTLPTDPPRPRDQNPSAAMFWFYYNSLLDPSSIDTAIENDVRDATAQLRPARLDDIVTRLENVYYPLPGGGALWPWRPSDTP